MTTELLLPLTMLYGFVVGYVVGVITRPKHQPAECRFKESPRPEPCQWRIDPNNTTYTVDAVATKTPSP